MKFEILVRKIGALDKVRQKSLSNHIRTISHSHTFTCLAQNGVWFSERFRRDEKFEILGSKIGALDKVRQKSLSNPSRTISHSHTLSCLAQNCVWFSERFLWDKKFEILGSKIGALGKIWQKSLSNPSHTISHSHTLTCLAQNGIWFSECFHRDEKFEILGSKIGALNSLKQ